ncbi:MAG: hypothetical protein SPI59_04760 [Finegoldia sp.]|nr:hypothetical protein [Finegoldia sp.]
MDIRGKKVVFLSHCILNQNSVVQLLARAKGAYRAIIEEIIKRDIGIYQMPCPECEFLGLKRKSMTYADYADLEGYRNFCKDLSEKVVQAIKAYLDDGYKVIGIIGINDSPTCSITGRRGVYMEELFKSLEENGLSLNTFEVDTGYVEGEDNELGELVKFLDRK